MFIRSFYYTFLQLIRQKTMLFWNLCFPLLLGTMYNVAFGGLAADEAFHAIPVAVVTTEVENDYGFSDTIRLLSEEGEDQFLDATFTTEEEAHSLLEKKEVIGILYGGSPITLTVSAEMTTFKLEQSILSAFVEQYNLNITAITDIAVNHPENLSDAIRQLGLKTDYLTETSYSDGNLDEKLTYFFNLIAMSCLYAYMSGIVAVTNSQANLSALGARRCISPVNKMLSLFAELCAGILYQFLCTATSLLYMIFVLKIDFGSELFYVLLAAFVGCTTGVSAGFFIGSFGKMSVGTKNGIMMAITMICSFLSGLMVGGMRILVAQICPWFNHVNPAALISDSFYALSVYRSHDRYFLNLATLLVLSALFYLGGFLLVRRKKYAAL